MITEYVDFRDFYPPIPVSAVDNARSEEVLREFWQLVQNHIIRRYKADYLRATPRQIGGRAALVRIPALLWLALYFMTVLAMLVIGF
ncbi:hypothetical protein [Microbulbifer sp. DLAB2-AA]|uniref:hypothetical protein n=1 Tax=Microbulbifer sp. DLAB2-AA TaxID=3243394 RepID=UPI004039D6FA